MTITFARIGHQDTYDHIFGACFNTYEWWGPIRKGWEGIDAPDWWSVIVPMEDPYEEGPDIQRVVSHHILLGTIQRIAKGEGGKYVSRQCEAECLAFLEDPDTADFDADTADQVMQVATLGEVVYG